MSRRLWFFPVLLAALAACSSTMSKPGQAAIGTGLAVAAAGVNRAVTGECWAACRPGTTCDRASGLCLEAGARPPPGSHQIRSRAVPGAAEYPPGHEYVVPPDPAISCAPDAGAVLECTPDGGVVTY